MKTLIDNLAHSSDVLLMQMVAICLHLRRTLGFLHILYISLLLWFSESVIKISTKVSFFMTGFIQLYWTEFDNFLDLRKMFLKQFLHFYYSIVWNEPLQALASM